MSNKELKQKLSELANMKNTVRGIENKIENMVAAAVRKDHPEIAPHDIYCPFVHECKKTPFGWCVYNETVHPGICIYCGEPYERK
jgi:D-aminopeptidase